MRIYNLFIIFILLLLNSCKQEQKANNDTSKFENGNIKELQTKNVKIDGGPVKRGDGKSIYFNDPDDNHLEIHCDNPSAS